MDSRVFGTVFTLALVAGGLAAWQHLRTVTTKKDDLRGTRTLITNSQSRLERKKADLEAAQTKLAVMQAVVSLDQEKKTLSTELQQLEAERADVQQKLADTLQRVRTAAMGAEWPDVTLPNGQTITGVKIQKSTDNDVALSHNGGVVKVSAKDLPTELKVRLGYGLNATGSP